MAQGRDPLVVKSSKPRRKSKEDPHLQWNEDTSASGGIYSLNGDPDHRMVEAPAKITVIPQSSVHLTVFTPPVSSSKHLANNSVDVSYGIDSTVNISTSKDHSHQKQSNMMNHDYSVQRTEPSHKPKVKHRHSHSHHKLKSPHGHQAHSTPPARHSPDSSNGIDDSDQSEKVKTKLMSVWNNMKYGWTVKVKTQFSFESPIFLLGKCYHRKNTVEQVESSNSKRFTKHKDHPESSSEVTDMDLFKQDFTSRIWFTYRREFPPIPGSQLTTDCGWGCMLRSGQMMLAQALVMHFLGRDWVLGGNPTKEEDAFHRQIIKWFGDYPGLQTPFSVHRLCQIGQESGKKPGDWYGPASVAHIMKHAVENAHEYNPILGELCVYVAQDCTIYKQDVMDLCTRRPRTSTSRASFSGSSSLENSCEKSGEEFWRSVIILIPVRLGGEMLNEIYVPCVTSALANDMCLGVIGGKPKHSLYFVGFQDQKLIHLDPHYCQDVVDVIRTRDFPVHTFHCVSPRKMSVSKMDPSCTLGFYCKTRQDFLNFVVQATEFLAPPMQRGQYPMFIFHEGKSGDNNCDDLIEKEERYLRIRHLDKDGRVRSKTQESEDFVFL